MLCGRDEGLCGELGGAGVLLERDGLVRSPFILVLASGRPLLLFLSLFFLASETYTKSRASEQTIILRCTTLHYPFIIHHTITFPPPVLPSSRRSIDLVHQRRSPAPTPLPSPLLLGGEVGWRARWAPLLF